MIKRKLGLIQALFCWGRNMTSREQGLSFASEFFVERDTILRTFCQALQAKEKIPDELVDGFDASVRQIAARKALRIGLSGDAVDEVVSETMVKILGAMVSGRLVPQNAPMAAYISTQAGWIAINLEKCTGVRRRREVPLELTLGERPVRPKRTLRISRPVEDAVERRLELEQAEKAMENLIPHQAEVMKMVATNYSREEIRKTLGLTDCAFRNVLYRSRRELKEGINNAS